MKNNLFFLLLFLLIGCTSSTDVTTKISCPSVLFSAEHSKYITANTKPITVENISYIAEINNYSFNKGCSIANGIFYAELSLLFVVNPYQFGSSDVVLPFYVTIINKSNKLVDMQYYQAKGTLQTNLETKDYTETELTKKIILQAPYLNDQEKITDIVVVGFMLDNKKLEILN